MYFNRVWPSHATLFSCIEQVMKQRKDRLLIQLQKAFVPSLHLSNKSSYVLHPS